MARYMQTATQKRHATRSLEEILEKLLHLFVTLFVNKD